MERTTHGGLRYREGELVQRVEYTPFGKERFVLNGSLEENPKFTGQIHDIDTDLYYFNARYYDPTLGRFIQADSIIPDVYNPQSVNPYSYVLNNPLKYIDPSGNEPIDPDDEDTIGSPNLENLDGDVSDVVLPGSDSDDIDATLEIVERDGNTSDGNDVSVTTENNSNQSSSGNQESSRLINSQPGGNKWPDYYI